MLFVGNDWAEAYHDVEVVDESGRCLVRRRCPEGIVGMAELHAVIADNLPVDAEASEVVVGIETDRGPWVAALVGLGESTASAATTCCRQTSSPPRGGF